MRENLEHVSTGKEKIAVEIVAGIYLSAEPDRLIGLAEMFDYKKRTNQITIGYRINEAYWHRGIATETVALLIAYLCDDIGIQTIKAFVMPENKYSERVLMNNGFTKIRIWFRVKTGVEKKWLVCTYLITKMVM